MCRNTRKKLTITRNCRTGHTWKIHREAISWRLRGGGHIFKTNQIALKEHYSRIGNMRGYMWLPIDFNTLPEGPGLIVKLSTLTFSRPSPCNKNTFCSSQFAFQLPPLISILNSGCKCRFNAGVHTPCTLGVSV